MTAPHLTPEPGIELIAERGDLAVFSLDFMRATGITHYDELVYSNHAFGTGHQVVEELDCLNEAIVPAMTSHVFRVMGRAHEAKSDDDEYYLVPPDFTVHKPVDYFLHTPVHEVAEFTGFAVRRWTAYLGGVGPEHIPSPYLALSFEPIRPHAPGFGVPVVSQHARILEVDPQSSAT
jgi:hypothetical protein